MAFLVRPSEAGHNQGTTDVMNQQRASSTVSIADFPSNWSEGDAPTLMMPWDPLLIFRGEVLSEPFDQGPFNHRGLRSDAPDGEVLLAPDDWEMTYATEEEGVNQENTFRGLREKAIPSSRRL
ncbi:hypothetical protein NCS52_01541200 [Fusarium sp. LHS14.1]|nr:hypothetical protein NCS52_01541200 [Fusarium sp. LHS14.1]